MNYTLHFETSSFELQKHNALNSIIVGQISTLSMAANGQMVACGTNCGALQHHVVIPFWMAVLVLYCRLSSYCIPRPRRLSDGGLMVNRKHKPLGKAIAALCVLFLTKVNIPVYKAIRDKVASWNLSNAGWALAIASFRAATLTLKSLCDTANFLLREAVSRSAKASYDVLIIE